MRRIQPRTPDEVAIVQILLARPGLYPCEQRERTHIPLSTLKRRLKEGREDGFTLPSGERYRLVSERGRYYVQEPPTIERIRSVIASAIAAAAENMVGWRTVRRSSLTGEDRQAAGSAREGAKTP